MGKIAYRTSIGLSLIILALVSLEMPTIVTNRAFGLSMDAIHYLSTPSLHNLDGDRIDSVEVGQQSMIRLSIHNNIPYEQPFVILVEIRDSNDVTTDVFWQSGIFGEGGNYTMETSWAPRDEDNNYQIRSFVVSDLDNPQVLSAVYGREEISVVSPIYQFCCTKLSERTYIGIIMNTSYSFEYTLNSGYITNIQADFDALNMLLTFEGISRDSYLSLKLPTPLMLMFFPDEQTVDLENLEDKIVLFLDEVQPPDYEIVEDSNHDIIKVEMPIPAQSQKLELVRDIII